MKLAIHDPEPFWNDYVSKMYLQPLEQLARNSGIAVKRIADPIPEFGWTMICNAGHLNRDLIRHFHANQCPLVAISCNDSAYLTEQLQHPDLWLVPLMFTISGVQRVNTSKQSVLNPDMTVTTRDVEFLPQGGWEIYDQMRRDGRLLPLPYVPWDRLPDVPIPEHKTPKILFRGGNHFWRFIAFLHALKAGAAHPASGFLTQDYFADTMVPQFRYCEKCREDWKLHGHRMFWSDHYTCECTSDLDLSEPLKWNNRSPRAFFQLARAFGIDDLQSSVEVALNFRRQPAEHHLRAIADAAFFADCKWEFSIHTAQRFWEAASVGTVNILPRRANDQEYFPHIQDEEHYYTFADDFEGFWNIPSRDGEYRHEQVGQEAKALYDHWIRPSEYVTNTRLLEHILTKISEVSA